MENAILLMIGLWLFSLIAVVGEYLFGEKNETFNRWANIKII